MWPAVAIGPVKCGTMPTLCVSHTRHDLEHLGDAADVGQRRAGEVDVALLDERAELRARAPLLAGRERHGRQQPQLRDLRAELLLAHRILDDERPRRLHEPADFHGLVEIELLVQVDHPVAVRADAVADLLDRLDDQPDVRSRIEHRRARRRRRVRRAARRLPRHRPAPPPPRARRCSAGCRCPRGTRDSRPPSSRPRAPSAPSPPLRPAARGPAADRTSRTARCARAPCRRTADRAARSSALPLMSHSARSMAPSACSRSLPGE